MGYCIPLWLRDEQIKLAIKKVAGRIQPYKGPEGEKTRPEPIAVVGFGPSLKLTWEKLKDFKYIISCSGAHKFLLERGVIPTWHLEVDPREHKIDLIGKPCKYTTYVPCSTVHPKYFDWLIQHKVNIELWHTFATDEEAMRILPAGEHALTGGCDAGMRAMAVARFLGFVDHHIFGMDGCAGQEENSHAAEHPKWTKKKWFDLEYPKGSGKIFRTTPALMEVARTVPKEVDALKIKATFYGDGFVQALMRDHKPKKGHSMLSFVKPELISKGYLDMQRKLHDNPEYGVGGGRHAQPIIELCERLKTTKVLDYGCGKGYLAKKMPFPIWEYDPAVPGKEVTPLPADIVVCADVLEHIEPENLKAVLRDLQRVTLQVGYFVVATRPAKKKLEDGRNAHLIIKDKAWWQKELSKYFDVAKVLSPPNSDEEAHFICGPMQTPKPAEDLAGEVEHDGTKAKFYTPNETTQWRVKTLITKEPATIKWIDTFEEGEILWDIGANVGGYTVWASARRKVKVYAFEPEAQNYALLIRNMALNKVDGVAYCLAFTDDVTKLSTIYLSGQEVGGSCNSFGEEVGPDLSERKGVPQGCIGMRMNDVVRSGENGPCPSGWIPQPDHIKIDVDGLEHKVVSGGAAVIAKAKSLLVEVNTNLEEHTEMVKWLEQLGFSYSKEQVEASIRKEGPFIGCAEFVFTRNAQSPEQEVLEKIKNAPLIMEPFPHLHIEDVFPADFYKEIEKAIPERGYQSLEKARGVKGYPQRFVIDAPACVNWMTNGKLRALLDEKFGVTSSSDETLLIRDFPGYTIAPHTDTPKKAVSALFYLPLNWTEAEHGTSIYKPKEEGYTDEQGVHGDRSNFVEVWTAPGKPNSVFIFARTDNSFHGAEPYEGEDRRDILLWDSKK